MLKFLNILFLDFFFVAIIFCHYPQIFPEPTNNCQNILNLQQSLCQPKKYIETLMPVPMPIYPPLNPYRCRTCPLRFSLPTMIPTPEIVSVPTRIPSQLGIIFF